MPIDDDFRNPIIIPDLNKHARGCPKCGSPDYDGRRVQGVITFTCAKLECKNVWSGGLPQEPMDPRIPRPPEPLTPPPVTFVKNSKTGEAEEIRSPVGLTQSFRTGVLVPTDEEEEL